MYKIILTLTLNNFKLAKKVALLTLNASQLLKLVGKGPRISNLSWIRQKVDLEPSENVVFDWL